MKYLVCIIFIFIAVVVNIPVLALVLGTIFVSIKSQQNLIAPNLGTQLLQIGIIIIGFTISSSSAINLISEFFAFRIYAVKIFFTKIFYKKN